MRKPSEVIINGKTLAEILENHLHWLKRDVDGWKEMRANLDGADIVNGNFYYADFSDASLTNTYLVGSHLVHADLQCANLGWADLRNCVFYDTDLRGCNFMYANLSGSEYVPYIPLQCPSDGEFVGWKKVNNVLIKLEIPADAKRSSATTNKCRCDKAKVLGFYNTLGTEELDITELVNDKYEKCRYVKSEMVYPDSFDEDRWNECSHGIHFFINKQDAINYSY